MWYRHGLVCAEAQFGRIDWASTLRPHSCRSLAQGHLQDAVPDLLGQHQLSIGRNPQQRITEKQSLILGQLYDVAPAQELDEISEQALVDELGRVQPVEYRHALRHQMTTLFERLM